MSLKILRITVLPTCCRNTLTVRVRTWFKEIHFLQGQTNELGACNRAVLRKAFLRNIFCRENFRLLFSKSVFDIKTRLVATVELGTKWMPNSDSAPNFMPQYKFLCLLGPTNSFYGYLKITRFFKNYMDFPYENKYGGNLLPPISILYGETIQESHKTSIFKQL